MIYQLVISFKKKHDGLKSAVQFTYGQFTQNPVFENCVLAENDKSFTILCIVAKGTKQEDVMAKTNNVVSSLSKIWEPLEVTIKATTFTVLEGRMTT